MTTAPVVLLVEDDPDDVFLVQRAFRKLAPDARLERVADGDEAIAYLTGDAPYADRQRFPLPALMLLDLKLPRRNGFEVLQWLRGQPGLRRLPVVVLTSSCHDADIDRAYDCGANSYLVKPVLPQALQALLAGLDVFWLRTNKPPSLRAD